MFYWLYPWKYWYKIAPRLEYIHATTISARTNLFFLLKYFQCKINISAIMTILYKYFQCKASISIIVMSHCKYFQFLHNIYLILIFYSKYLQWIQYWQYIRRSNLSIICLLVKLKWAFLYNIHLTALNFMSSNL